MDVESIDGVVQLSLHRCSTSHLPHPYISQVFFEKEKMFSPVVSNAELCFTLCGHISFMLTWDIYPIFP